MKRLFFVMSIVLLLATSSSFAAFRYWEGDVSTDWSNTANWKDNLYPVPADKAYIGTVGAYSVGNAVANNVTFSVGLLQVADNFSLTLTNNSNFEVNTLASKFFEAKTGGVLTIDAGSTLSSLVTSGIGGTDGSAGTLNLSGTYQSGDKFFEVRSGGIVNLNNGGLLTMGSGNFAVVGRLNLYGGTIMKSGDWKTAIDDMVAAGFITKNGLNYAGAYNSTNNVTTFAVVPEPATMLLLGLGGLLFARRK